MSWKWETADKSGLTDLWNLKTDLSTSRKVIYSKWYQGKATFISKEMFCAMLKILNPEIKNDKKRHISKTSSYILELLEAILRFQAKN